MAAVGLVRCGDEDDAPIVLEQVVTLFRFVKKNLGLDFNDLTFANFKGITVPESAFKEA